MVLVLRSWKSSRPPMPTLSASFRSIIKMQAVWRGSLLRMRICRVLPYDHEREGRLRRLAQHGVQVQTKKRIIENLPGRYADCRAFVEVEGPARYFRRRGTRVILRLRQGYSSAGVAMRAEDLQASSRGIYVKLFCISPFPCSKNTVLVARCSSRRFADLVRKSRVH